MKKKLLTLLVLAALFNITGCKNNETAESNTPSINETTESSGIIVGSNQIELNAPGTFNEMSYYYPKESVTSSLGTYNIIDYMDGELFVFRIAIARFENKSVEEAMEAAAVITEAYEMPAADEDGAEGGARLTPAGVMIL